MGRQPVRAKCRRDVGKLRAQIEGLVTERYGGLTEKPNQDADNVTRETAKQPQPSTSTGVKVSAAEPLDGRDPDPRTRRDPRTRSASHSDELSDDVARGGSKAGSEGVSNGESARGERLGRASASGRT